MNVFFLPKKDDCVVFIRRSFAWWVSTLKRIHSHWRGRHPSQKEKATKTGSLASGNETRGCWIIDQERRLRIFFGKLRVWAFVEQFLFHLDLSETQIHFSSLKCTGKENPFPLRLFVRRLGQTVRDLRNDMRVLIWKGRVSNDFFVGDVRITTSSVASFRMHVGCEKCVAICQTCFFKDNVDGWNMEDDYKLNQPTNQPWKMTKSLSF